MLKAKEWQQAADTMKQVADLNKYEDKGGEFVDLMNDEVIAGVEKKSP